MRYLLLVCFYLFSLGLNAQSKCSFSLDSFRVIPAGKSMTLKWSVNPKPTKGYFKIYRKRIQRPSISLIETVKTNYHFGRTEYCDQDQSLSLSNSYEYRLELIVGNQKCSSKAEIHTRAVEDADSVATDAGKNISSFKKEDIYDIIPEKLTAKAFTNCNIRLKIKNLKYPVSTDLRYYLFVNNVLYKTTYFVENDNYRTAVVYINQEPVNAKSFKIALVQDDTILGISPLITFEN